MSAQHGTTIVFSHRAPYASQRRAIAGQLKNGWPGSALRRRVENRRAHLERFAGARARNGTEAEREITESPCRRRDRSDRVDAMRFSIFAPRPGARAQPATDAASRFTWRGRSPRSRRGAARGGQLYYLALRTPDDGLLWAVTLGGGAPVGAEVRVRSLGRQRAFHSRRLDRIFPELIFGIVSRTD